MQHYFNYEDVKKLNINKLSIEQKQLNALLEKLKLKMAKNNISKDILA